jgi:Glyoxalase-like domain
MMELVSHLDHLVVVAPRLEEGVAWCEERLGVKLTRGGEHVRLGTHNSLLRLSDTTYLEVIAINPAASAPTWPRWFGMDDPGQRQRAASGPYLANFVVRSNALVKAVAVLPGLGVVRDMERGDLRWQIAIPEDGRLLENGTVPSVIQWAGEDHPAKRLPDAGCRLERLEILHPRPTELLSSWGRIGLREGNGLQVTQTPSSESPHLIAWIATPSGLRCIR